MEILIIALFKDLRSQGKLVKYVCCDNAGENIALEKACKKEGLGTTFEYTSPNSPQCNGRVERKFVTLQMRSRANLNGSKVTKKQDEGFALGSLCSTEYDSRECPCYKVKGYDYDSKYSGDSRTELLIPAPLDEETTREVRRLGVAAFRAVDACGLARVDAFVERAGGRVLLNEINTMPGFTSISMYPRLWEASGLPFPELLARLVELAVERRARRSRLRTDYRA